MIDLERVRVLVADDDPDILKVITYALHSMGFRRLRLTDSGVKAIAIYTNCPVCFDVIICDWMMPDVTGLDVLKAVRKISTDIPFMMLTAKSETDDVRIAVEAGVTSYVAKPFTIANLKQRIINMLPEEDDEDEGVSEGDGKAGSESGDEAGNNQMEPQARDTA